MRNTLTAGVTALGLAGAVLIAAPAAEAAGRGTTKLHGTKNHTVTIDRTLRPGVVHFHNTGSTPILIVRKKKAGTKTFAKLFNKSGSSAERKALKAFDVVEIAFPKSNSWVKLRKGTYFLADGDAKVKVAKVRVVVVKGHTLNATLPRATKLRFDAAGHLPAATTIGRKSAIRLVNNSRTIAFAITLKIKSSLTDDEVKQIVAHPTEDKVFGAVSDEYRVDLLPAAIGPKRSATVATKYGAGRYLAMTGHPGGLHRGDVGLLTVR